MMTLAVKTTANPREHHYDHSYMTVLKLLDADIPAAASQRPVAPGPLVRIYHSVEDTEFCV